MVSPGPGLFVGAAEEAPDFPKAEEEEAVADEVEVVAAVVDEEEPDSLIVF